MVCRIAMDNYRPRDACNDVDDRKRASRRTGAVFLVAVPDDLRHGGRASAAGLRCSVPENLNSILLEET
jgi:hypothetical protein